MKVIIVFKYVLCVTLVICGLFLSQASNVRITTPTIIYSGDAQAPAKLGDSLAHISFDVAWENSWRTVSPNNWDAVWIYAKFYDGTAWYPVFLSKDATDHVPGDVNASGYYVNTKTGDKKGKMTISTGLSISYNDYTKKHSKECVGVFLYRTALGEGKVRANKVKLLWNYKNQGQTKDNDLVVKVFTVEMVYVRDGAFYVGDGNDNIAANVRSYGSFIKSDGSNSSPFKIPAGETTSAYRITSEDAIETGRAQGKLYNYYGQEPTILNDGVIPKTYPKGYNAFYAMKYELTQEAYAEMLNCLTSQQANNCTPQYDEVAYANTPASVSVGSIAGQGWTSNQNIANIYRIVISWKKGSGGALIYGCDANGYGGGNNLGAFNQTAKYLSSSGVPNDTAGVPLYVYDGDTMAVSIDGQDLPMHRIRPIDVLSYASFAGLRPMTEFEYEKLCRGPKDPIPGEYAWGNGSVNALDASLSINMYHTQNSYGKDAGPEYYVNRNTGKEGPLRSLGANAGTGYVVIPWLWYGQLLRVGSFADTNTNRVSSGAGYWGAMNLSDNAWELCIRAGTAGSNKFVGAHGSGLVNPDGRYMAFRDTSSNKDGSKIDKNPWVANDNSTQTDIFVERGVPVKTISSSAWTWNNYTTRLPDGAVAEWNYARTSSRYRNGSGYNISPSTERTWLGIRCVRTDGATE
ncbi:MAG: hypothetical protein LBQ31_05715 [Bacteroidales bacterium]|jgi:hypothetical protein|nr:hypothetical protein [Bacteroidales bacterium]